MTLPRSRAIAMYSGLEPGYVVEFSRLIDAGMVFYWDASGPLSGRDRFASEGVEFAYLSLDTRPVQLWIKRSNPGVSPIVWDPGPALPDFTLADLNDARAAVQVLADQAAALNASSAAMMAQMKSYAAQAIDAAARVINKGTTPFAEWVTLFEQIMSTLPTDVPALPNALWRNNGSLSITDPSLVSPDAGMVPSDVAALAATIALLPNVPPPQAGMLWNNNGTLAITGAPAPQQPLPNTVLLRLQRLGSLFAALPTAPPPVPGAVWNDNGNIAVTAGSPTSQPPLAEFGPTFAVYPDNATALASILPGHVQDAKINGRLSRWANDNGTLVDLLAPH